MRKYVAEFLGTFALVFAGTGAVVVNQISGGAITHPGVALTFGLIVMSLVYALGDVSGAHFNSAVTVGFFLAKRLPGRCVVPYVAAQLAGALLASGALRLLFGNVANLGATLPHGSDAQSFVLEVILTAMLMFVVLCVATGSKEQGLMAGIAVGGLVALEAMFAGPICGASMNPARSIAPAVVTGNLHSLWVYVTAPLVGAALAVPCWHATRAAD
jgi:aquaporin NIP